MIKYPFDLLAHLKEAAEFLDMIKVLNEACFGSCIVIVGFSADDIAGKVVVNS